MSSEGSMSRSDVELLLKSQQTAFEGFLRSFMDSVNGRIDSVLTQVVEAKTALNTVTERLNALACKDEEVAVSIKDIQERLEKVDSHADYLENQSRRNNLRVDGVAKDPRESWEASEVKIKDLLVTSLGFSVPEAESVKIERAHRTGKGRPLDASRAPDGNANHSARTIVVKFNSYKDRELVLKRSKDRHPTGVYISEDFSQRVIETRKSLLPERKRHRDAGRIAYFSYDKLIVRDKTQ